MKASFSWLTPKISRESSGTARNPCLENSSSPRVIVARGVGHETSTEGLLERLRAVGLQQLRDVDPTLERVGPPRPRTHTS